MSNTLKLGLFTTFSLLVLAALILSVDDTAFFERGEKVEAEFLSVVGLDRKAAVRVAGVRVGKVEAIRLERGKAVVTLLLEESLGLTEGTKASISNVGLLGEKFVEITPGPADAPPLGEGAYIPGETPITFDQAMAKLGKVGDSIQDMTQGLGGEGGGGIANLIGNLEAVSADIRELVAANRTVVTSTIGNFESFSGNLAREVPRLTTQLSRVLDQIDQVIAENRESLSGGLQGVKTITDEVQVSVRHLNTITEQLASGEGTLGKLIQSDEAHTSLVDTLNTVQGGVDSLSETLGKLKDTKISLGLEGYYLGELEESRSSFRLDIMPSEKRFYRIAIVDDPRGKEHFETETITWTREDGTSQTSIVERLLVEDKTQISALFGFPLLDRGKVYAGLIENSAGVQVDWDLVDDRWWLSFEAFDFDRARELEPHLRFLTGYRLHPNFYLVGGYDDFLEDEFESYFFGAGIHWRDDDLKYLMGKLPTNF